MNQEATPLYRAIKKHAEGDNISLHVPGHKNGILLQNSTIGQDFLKLDVTELTNLDDLHSPEGIILEAEGLLAEAYKAKRSFFLINGSTVGNLAMLMGTLHEGDTVFVQRNCHKSILNGVELVKAQPILLGPEENTEWGVAGGVSLHTVKSAYNLYPDCKAIVLTYPNYYGMTYDLEGIIQFAHKNGMLVLVDEAHGAHFIGGSYFPPSAIELGADVVVQSAHKTLPAMTMGAYLHVNSDNISLEMINHYLRVLQSSSPSYPIMASLDLAREYISSYSNEDEQFLKVVIKGFKNELHQIDEIKVLEYPNRFGDPLKITIQSKCGYTGYELQCMLEEQGIFTEMADPKNVLLILPLLKKGTDFPFSEISSRIKIALSGKGVFVKEESEELNYFSKAKISTIHRSDSHSTKELPLKKAKNYICAETIIPYPPGIPFLLRGEKITEEDINGLSLLLKSGARFQGGEYISNGSIKVYCKLEDNYE